MKYMVVDTETTISSYPSRLVFDLGFVISDGKGNIVETFRCLVSDVVANSKVWNAKTTTVCDSEDFTADKFSYYVELVEKHDLPIISMRTLNDYISQVIKRHNIKTWYAYNVAFDANALDTTWAWATDTDEGFPAFAALDKKCIMCATQNSLCKTKRYFEWAMANALSEKGNIRTSAEMVYRFITGNNEYREAHTALADAIDETRILHHVRGMKGKRIWDKGFNYQAIARNAKMMGW